MTTPETTLYMPSYIDQAIVWAVELSKGSAGVQADFASVTACTYTSFMFDGVIHYLGGLLRADWVVLDANGKIVKKESKSFCGIDKTHKRVRSALEMDNSGADYREAADIIRILCNVRDVIAHPKAVHMEKTDEWKSVAEDVAKVEEWYQYLRQYSVRLLERAADQLETQHQTDEASFYARYPQLKDKDIKQIIHTLRCFFSSSESHN